MKVHFNSWLALAVLAFTGAVGSAQVSAPPAAASPAAASPAAGAPNFTQPKVIKSVATSFPECKGLSEGSVSLNFIVGLDGLAADIHVTESPGEAQGTCAIVMIRAQRFAPATVQGKPIPVRIAVRMDVKSN